MLRIAPNQSARLFMSSIRYVSDGEFLLIKVRVSCRIFFSCAFINKCLQDRKMNAGKIKMAHSLQVTERDEALSKGREMPFICK